MLLYRLHKLALELRPLLPLCYLLGFGGAALTAYLLFREATSSTFELGLALGLTVWALLLFAFVHLFQSIPPPVLPGDSFLVRLWTRCKLAFYHVLALGVVIIGVVLLSMSLKLLSITG